MKNLYAFTKKYPAIMRDTTSFKRLPATNQINDHRADLKACACCLPAYFSQRYAHTNGPPISPKSPNGQMTMPNTGNTIIDTTSPILLPRTPRWVPQNFFVPRDGMAYSKTIRNATITARTMKNIQLNGCAEVNCSKMNAIYIKIKLGKTGRIAPMIARIVTIVPMMIKNISITQISKDKTLICIGIY